MKKIIIIIICCLCLCGCGSDTITSDNNSSQQDVDKNQSTEQDNSNQSAYGLDKPFEFDDLEITISSQYSFSVIDNVYSEQYQQSVVRIPVTVKNLKEETHSLNMFYFSFYGSQGVELDNVSSYFDDSIEFAGSLRTGASYTKYFYLLYDGDGTYTIEFYNYGPKIDIDIDVVKQ